MRNLLLGCSVVLFTIAAAPASAAPDSAGSHSAPALTNQIVSNDSAVAPVGGGSAQPVADKKICKQLPSSYSRMTQRTCLTAKQWEQVERDSQ